MRFVSPPSGRFPPSSVSQSFVRTYVRSFGRRRLRRVTLARTFLYTSLVAKPPTNIRDGRLFRRKFSENWLKFNKLIDHWYRYLLDVRRVRRRRWRGALRIMWIFFVSGVSLHVYRGLLVLVLVVPTTKCRINQRINQRYRRHSPARCIC